MYSFEDHFRPRVMWQVIKRAAYLSSWIGRLIAATAEIFLHRNFGRRYLLLLSAGFLFYCFLASMVPFAGPLRAVSILVMLILIVCHFSFARNRHRLGAVEPLSIWSGDSWDVWRELGMREEFAQAWIEPILCFSAAVALVLFDPFVGLWLVLAGVSLFLKVHITNFLFRRQIAAAADARLKAQRFNTALQQYMHQPNQGAQRVHRARLPGGNRRTRP